MTITGEVYEHLVFDHARHLPLAGFDGDRNARPHFQSAAKMPAGKSDLQPSRTHRARVRAHNVPELCGRRAVSACGRPRAGHRRRLGGGPSELVAGPARPAGSGLTEIGFAVHDSYGTYFYAPTRARWSYDDEKHRILCGATGESQGGPPSRCRLRDPAAGQASVSRCVEPPGALHLLQTRRHLGGQSGD